MTNPSPPSQDSRALEVADVEALASRLADNVGAVIVGHEETVEHVITAILARGHVLIEDVPGVGKTMLARSIARSIDCSFRRIQFTPDMLPADVTGSNVLNQRTQEFEFREGPIFANVVLADEINRAPPKTQSALLEAMEESQVTVDGETRALPDPHVVVATQNAVEADRAYELPLAEVDRFMKWLSLGYPSVEEETELLDRTVGHHPVESIEPVTDVDAVVAAREAVASVQVAEPVRDYASRLANWTRREHEIGVSPRGTIALLRASQARAAVSGRDYVTPDDVKEEAPAVWRHRLEPVAGDGVVTEALANVPVECD